MSGHKNDLNFGCEGYVAQGEQTMLADGYVIGQVETNKNGYLN